jgi:hypothetical protein
MSRPVLPPCLFATVRIGFFATALIAGVTRAQNLEQSFYTALYPANGPYQVGLDVPQFDPALGTLVEARISVTPHFGSTLRAENTDTFAPQTVTLLFAGTVMVSRNGSMLAAASTGGYVSQFLLPFDGTVDFSGNSGMSQSLNDDQGSTVSIHPDSPQFAGFLAQFGSTKAMHLQVEAVLDPECDPYGNPAIVFESRTATAPEITVTYVYSTSGAAFCPGDGTASTCPCSNPGQAGHGCASPSAPSGALLMGTGDASVSADTLGFTLTDLPQATMLVLLQTDASSTSGAPFGAGLRCVTGNTIRIKALAVGTSAQIGAGTGNSPISVVGRIPATGATYYYQAAFREGQGACNGAPINFTNGWRVAWRP